MWSRMLQQLVHTVLSGQGREWGIERKGRDIERDEREKRKKQNTEEGY